MKLPPPASLNPQNRPIFPTGPSFTSWKHSWHYSHLSGLQLKDPGCPVHFCV